MKVYAKFAAQVFFTLIAALVAALVDDRIDFTEWLNAGVMTLGAVAVLGAGNMPAGVWAYMKTIVSAATAGLVFWQSAASGGMTSSEWLQLALAVAAVLGVYAVPGPRVSAATGPAVPNLR